MSTKSLAEQVVYREIPEAPGYRFGSDGTVQTLWTKSSKPVPGDTCSNKRTAMSSRPYIFPGVWPFIEKIARATGRDLHQLGRAREVWHCKQIQDALGQLPRLDPVSQRALLDHAKKLRESLALALEGCDAAIAEVEQECGLGDAKPRRRGA